MIEFIDPSETFVRFDIRRLATVSYGGEFVTLTGRMISLRRGGRRAIPRHLLISYCPSLNQTSSPEAPDPKILAVPDSFFPDKPAGGDIVSMCCRYMYMLSLLSKYSPRDTLNRALLLLNSEKSATLAG